MAKTRLTNALRDQILANVLKATNFEKEADKIRAASSALAREVVLAQVPVGFLELVKGQPREWFQVTASLYFGVSREEYSPLYALSIDKNWEDGRSVCFEPIQTPSNFSAEFSDEDKQRFTPLFKKATKLLEKHLELKSQIRQFLYSCTTVEAVVEKMPELQKHIPKAERFFPPAVNVSNLFTALTAAGFDNTVTT